MIFIRIVIPLFIIFGILNLFVGITNDAVNFLGSAVGSGAAKRRRILLVSSIGILLGSFISAGMMDVTGGEIIRPELFDLPELLSLLAAAMITNILLIDTFNTLKIPTSTTIAVVFELTGGALAIALIRNFHVASNIPLPELINTNKVLLILAGIVLSILISVFLGLMIQFIARLLFTFKYKERSKVLLSVFGGLAISAISFMIFKKAATGPAIDDLWWHQLISGHLPEILITIFAGSTFIFFFLSLTLDIDISRIVVMFGTFALALSFAANDLVNFIGMPLTGIKRTAETYGIIPMFDTGLYLTVILMVSALIMSITLFFSKKAQGVTETELLLFRQGTGRERFGTFPAAVFIVGLAQKTKRIIAKALPAGFTGFLAKRFEPAGTAGPGPEKEEVYFDNIRAVVNLTIAGLFISLGTYFRFPLSTTFVVFMVAAGAAIADNAWKKENAAHRVAGVIYIMAGWFITAVAAFLGSFALAIVIFYGRTAALTVVAAILFYRLYKTTVSHDSVETSEQYNKKANVVPGLNDIDEKIKKIILECSKIYLLSVNSFVDEDKSSSSKTAKEAKQLYNKAEDDRSDLFASLIKIEDSGLVQANMLIQTFDHFSEMLKNLAFIAKTLKGGYSKKGSRLTVQQRSELHNLSDEVSTFFNFMIHIIKEKRFESIPELISKQQMIISYMEDLRTAQIKRAKNKSGSTKGGLLFIEVLADTKNLLLSSVNFLNTYRKYA